MNEHEKMEVQGIARSEVGCLASLFCAFVLFAGFFIITPLVLRVAALEKKMKELQTQHS